MAEQVLEQEKSGAKKMDKRFVTIFAGGNGFLQSCFRGAVTMVMHARPFGKTAPRNHGRELFFCYKEVVATASFSRAPRPCRTGNGEGNAACIFLQQVRQGRLASSRRRRQHDNQSLSMYFFLFHTISPADNFIIFPTIFSYHPASVRHTPRACRSPDG